MFGAIAAACRRCGLGLRRATTYVQSLTLADVSVSAAAQNQLAELGHPPTHCSQAVEDSRMNVLAVLFVIVFAWWLSTLIID